MRFLLLCLLTALCSLGATAQTLPTSSGSCSVSASGVMGCNWLSGVPMLHADASKAPKPASKGVFVTRFSLAPGAPLHRTMEGEDLLIVAMDDGTLVNEAKQPVTPLNVTNGMVMFMGKAEPYLFRNTSNQNLDLLVIDVRK